MDLIALLNPRGARAGNRLRDHRCDLWPQFQAEIDLLLAGRGVVCLQRPEQLTGGVAQSHNACVGIVVAGDRDPVAVVGQRLGEPSDDNSLAVPKAKKTGSDANLIPFVERPVTTGPLDRDRVERRRVDLLAAIKPERQLGRRLTQNILLTELEVLTAVGCNADQLRAEIASEQFASFERLDTEPTLSQRGGWGPTLAKISP